MSQRPRHYFLAATGNPPEGPIKLGNIISLPRLADDPINQYTVPVASFPGMEVLEHNEKNPSFDINHRKGGQIGIWASFLQMLGVGGDISVETATEGGESWLCDNMQTLSFTPKLEYIVECLKDEGVQHFMRVNKPWLRTSKLYMITGIKIAYGASSTVQWAQDRGLNLHLGVDLTGLGCPVQVGPDFTRDQSVKVVQSQNGADPFVFAFRLRRIKISKSGSIDHQQFNKGAMLGLRERGGSELDDDTDIVVEGIEDDDVDGSEFQLLRKSVADNASLDNSACTCSAPE